MIYRGMIDSLLCLTSDKFDIMHSAYLCERFQSYQKECHLRVVKRIFRYLVGSTNLCLCFKKIVSFRLEGFCDPDYVEHQIERKSTSGGC